jgi:ABC-type dipeptide/oligopeptide/nickel transport system permease subunit
MRRWQRFFLLWQNWIAFLLILGYLSVAVLAPYLSPNDPDHPGAFIPVGKVFVGEPQPPDEKAILGTLPFGIDVYHPLVWGSRGALLFGLIVTSSTALFGVIYGAVSGFAGNRLSSLMLRVADSFLAFPPIAGVVLLQQLFVTSITAVGGYFLPTGEIFSFSQEPLEVTLIQSLLETIDPLMLSLIAFSWMPYARLIHSIVLTLKQTEFVQAAQALGGGPFWIIRKHLLRNSIGPAIVLAARDIGGVVLLQATLTFIGIGGGSIWGEMLAQGRNWVIGPGGSMLRYWWVFLPPTFAVMLFGITWNMLGDGLNDVLEPTSGHGYARRPFWRWRREKTETQETVEEITPLATLPVQSPSVEEQALPAQSLKKTISTNGIDRVLAAARDELSRGDLAHALYAYGHLIRRGRRIDDVLPDLARLVKIHPRDPQVWQTLGDALARAGRSEYASQSYEQARKLQKES